MAQKDITDRFVIAGRTEAREKVKVVVKERASTAPKKTTIRRILEKRSRPDITGSSNYRLPKIDVVLIRDLSKRLARLIGKVEYRPWHTPVAFLLWVHAKSIRLDLMAMTVLDDDELLVEFRRMLFNFNHKYLAFKPGYRPKFARRKRHDTTV